MPGHRRIRNGSSAENSLRHQKQGNFSHGGEMTLEGQEDPMTLFIADWERVPERFDGEVEYTEIGTVAPR